MKPYIAKTPAAGQASQASQELSIAVTLKSPQGVAPTTMLARASSESIEALKPHALNVDDAIAVLRKKGFKVSGRGSMTVSVRGSKTLYEKVFGTELSEFQLPRQMDYSAHAVFYPAEGAAWKPDPELAAVIDDAYIQWPHIYMAKARPAPTRAKPAAASKKPAKKTSAAVAPAAKARPPAGGVSGTPPKVTGYYNLDVLKDVPRLLGVSKIHQAGNKGQGIRVVMIDTGFAHSHPFFVRNGFTSSVVLAPRASSRSTDPQSHGTGESANIFAIAPQVTFIGVKLVDDANPNGGSSILEGLQEALLHKPHVISISMGYDLRDQTTGQQLAQLPNGLKALEAEIQAAIASGIVVVFSAGNGHYSFPGSMPEVISAGGVFVDLGGAMRASDYASAFPSAVYSGRSVPDFCGLVGLLPHADYIMLPVPKGEEIDRTNSPHDLTKPNDGWAVFSGTSAAAPQLAAVCALLLQKNSSLSAADIKAILRRTSIDVVTGHANPASDRQNKGLSAGPGPDGATGSGLVNAHAAWLQA